MFVQIRRNDLLTHGLLDAGATFTLPLLMDLAHEFANGIKCKHVDFVVVFQRTDSRRWMDSNLALAAKLAEAAGVSLTMRVYVTRGDPATPEDVEAGKDIDLESVDSKLSGKDDMDVGLELDARAARPDLAELVKNACASELGGRVAFAGESHLVRSDMSLLIGVWDSVRSAVFRL